VLAPWFSRAGVLTMGIPDKLLRELEQKLGYKEGTLAPDSPFLETYTLRIPSEGKMIDTSSPTGELQYQFALHHYKVASNPQSITPRHDFVLKNEDAEATVENLKLQKKIDALKIYDKMSNDDMKKCLRLYGQKSDTMSNELVRKRLADAIEANPEDFFFKWVNNTDKETEFLLESAVAAGVITKTRTSYKYGTDLIGGIKEDAIAYLKDKANSDLRNTITNEVSVKQSI
jgi:hypothetical protein